MYLLKAHVSASSYVNAHGTAVNRREHEDSRQHGIRYEHHDTGTTKEIKAYAKILLAGKHEYEDEIGHVRAVKRGDKWEATSISVNESHRRKGIATTLLKKMHQETGNLHSSGVHSRHGQALMDGLLAAGHAKDSGDDSKKYELFKAHVRDYDRVSKTGAIEHIRAHEDHRVRSYARKILGSANSYDLHQIRRDRFGHLPHWNKLDDHTQHAILDAEDEKAKGHKEFEEWVETHGSKKGKKKDAEKVDRSGWEQQLMFKSRRVQHVAYILRKSNVRSSTHANAAGKVWQQSSYTNKVVAKAKAEQLLTAPSGTTDFGVFHQEASEATGYPSAAIRLQVGEHNDKTGKGYGKVHIKSRHWKKEIKPAGYASVLTFVEDVASNFDAVYQVDKGRLALVKEDGNLAAIVEIERKDGEEFYKVITAYIANKNKFVDQTPLWRRSQSSHPETGDQEPSELGLAKSVEVSLRQRYPTSTDGQSGAVTTNLSPPKNKSNNPLHLFRRRGC